MASINSFRVDSQTVSFMEYVLNYWSISQPWKKKSYASDSIRTEFHETWWHNSHLKAIFFSVLDLILQGMMIFSRTQKRISTRMKLEMFPKFRVKCEKQFLENSHNYETHFHFFLWVYPMALQQSSTTTIYGIFFI